MSKPEYTIILHGIHGRGDLVFRNLKDRPAVTEDGTVIFIQGGIQNHIMPFDMFFWVQIIQEAVIEPIKSAGSTPALPTLRLVT